jgi:hypothetical protein
LPSTWGDFLPSTFTAQFIGGASGRTTGRIPLIRMNQNGQARIADWYGSFQLYAGTEKAYMWRCVIPADAARQPYYANAIIGDSGQPAFVLINGEPVLLGVTTGGGTSTGTLISEEITAVNTMMTTLGGGYQLTAIDLSAFPTY